MKNINTSDCSLKCEINGVLYNYRVVKCDKKANTGVVELAKVGGKKPKYATIDYVDAKFDGLNAKVNDLAQELLTKLDNLQK
ncbi:MAG: hypothetical protein LBE13_04405 [Bacteroidales bacterium]|jgi:heme-binding NEAT domain protein|nr:hypothetical protein [Bacteroidales bacterium]